MPAHWKKLIAAAIPLLGVSGCGQERPASEAGNATGSVTATYVCQPELNLRATYSEAGPTSMAHVTIDGKAYALMNVISASGAKYATDQGRAPGKTLVWWTKGRDGTLYEGNSGDASSQDVEIATCSERTR